MLKHLKNYMYLPENTDTKLFKQTTRNRCRPNSNTKEKLLISLQYQILIFPRNLSANHKLQFKRVESLKWVK